MARRRQGSHCCGSFTAATEHHLNVMPLRWWCGTVMCTDVNAVCNLGQILALFPSLRLEDFCGEQPVTIWALPHVRLGFQPKLPNRAIFGPLRGRARFVPNLLRQRSNSAATQTHNHQSCLLLHHHAKLPRIPVSEVGSRRGYHIAEIMWNKS
ncbi:hypothetical protein BS78_01G382400 [Paspalum vaginatum]|nr:hypothetical protein BS78_01G382400 [Paspalum vaginatum]